MVSLLDSLRSPTLLSSFLSPPPTPTLKRAARSFRFSFSSTLDRSRSRSFALSNPTKSTDARCFPFGLSSAAFVFSRFESLALGLCLSLRGAMMEAEGTGEGDGGAGEAVG